MMNQQDVRAGVVGILCDKLCVEPEDCDDQADLITHLCADWMDLFEVGLGLAKFFDLERIDWPALARENNGANVGGIVNWVTNQLLASESNEAVDLEWARKRTAVFDDIDRRTCILGDSSAAEARALRFGVVEPQPCTTMHLRSEDLSPILEHLRDFVRDGTLPAETKFSDWNGRECVIRPSAAVQGALDLGVTAQCSPTLGDENTYPIANCVMTLSRELMDQLLRYINSFVAHGSVRPD